MNPEQFATHNQHFKRFPCLTPWVGSSYQSPNHKKLLIIAESHYLPKGSTIHHDAARWYNELTEADLGTSLDDKGVEGKEIRWLSTAGIMGSAENRQRNFYKRGHAIHRNICNLLSDIGITETLPNHACDHYAYYNFFQRPAEHQGGSINQKPLDLEIAAQILAVVLDALTPDLVVFTSTKAGMHGKSICLQRDIPTISVPHPACAWWHRKSGKANINGRDKMRQFLEHQQWVKAKDGK